MAKREDRRSLRDSEALGDYRQALLRIAPEWRATLPERIERFEAGQMNPNGITILMQDLIHLGILGEMPKKFITAALHCCVQRLCTPIGGYLQ